jgi:hypothetical protein
MAIGDILRELGGRRMIRTVAARPDQHDVQAILGALFDIRADVKDIRDFLVGDDDGEQEEASDT